jgi:hypothetical protein
MTMRPGWGVMGSAILVAGFAAGGCGGDDDSSGADGSAGAAASAGVAGAPTVTAGTAGAAGPTGGTAGAAGTAGSGGTVQCGPGEELIQDTCIARHGDLGQISPDSGSTPVDPSAPVVEEFGPAIHQGEAPFTAEIAWVVSSPVGETLTCSIDFEGDGTVDETVENCSQSTLSHTYETVGRHTPVLTVTDESGRQTQRAELVYANHLELAENVHVVRELAELVSATYDATSVTLEFGGASSVPDLQDRPWSSPPNPDRCSTRMPAGSGASATQTSS